MIATQLEISDLQPSMGPQSGPVITTAEKQLKDAKRQLVLDCYRMAIRNRSALDTKRLKWWKQYMSINDPITRLDTGQEIKGLSNLFMPWTYGMVEQRVPRVIGKIPSFQVVGEDQEFDPQWADAIQQMLRKDLERAGYFMSAILHIKQAEIYGWSVRANFWRYEEGKRSIRKPIREPLSGCKVGYQQDCERYVKYDDPWTELIDVWRCYTQPGSLSIETSDWFIHESIQSRKAIAQKAAQGLFDKDEVIKMFRESRGVSAFGNVTTGESGLTDNPYWTRMNAVGLTPDQQWSGEDQYPRHRILTHWTDEEIITLGDEQYVLRVDPNPYGRKPFRELKVVPIPFMQNGMGAVPIMQDLQRAMNSQENQRIDAINLAINKVILAPDDAADWDQMVMFPGNRVPCDDPSRLKFLEVPPVGPDSYQETQRLMEASQWISAINDYIAPSQGSNTRLNKTASGVQAIQEQSNVIFSLISQLFELQDVQPTAEDFYHLRQQFQDRKRLFRVMGKKGYDYVAVTPDDLGWTPDIRPVGGSAQPTDKREEISKATTVFNTLWGNPQAVQLGVDQKVVLKDFLAAIGETGVDRLFGEQQEDLLSLIQKEHEAMAYGQPVPPVGDPQQHILLHELYMESPFFMEIDPTHQVLFRDHLQAHEAKLAGTGTGPYFDQSRDDAIQASQMPATHDG